MQTLLKTVTSPEFLAGFRWGVVGASVAAVGGWWWHRQGRPAPLAGLAVAGAAVWAMGVVRESDPKLLAGLAVLALGGLFFPLTRRTPVLAVVAAIPGAWLVSQGRLPDPPWVPLLIAISVPLIAALLARFEEVTGDTGWSAPLIGLSVAGAFLTLPDTEEAMVLLGATIAPALATWPLRWVSWGFSGAYSFAGVFLWTVVWGGRGRLTAVVGALAALGLTIAVPVAAWIGNYCAQPLRTRVWMVFGAQTLTVFLASRVVGMRPAMWEAILIALAVLVGAGWSWRYVDQRMDTERHLP